MALRRPGRGRNRSFANTIAGINQFTQSGLNTFSTINKIQTDAANAQTKRQILQLQAQELRRKTEPTRINLENIDLLTRARRIPGAEKTVDPLLKKRFDKLLDDAQSPEERQLINRAIQQRQAPRPKFVDATQAEISIAKSRNDSFARAQLGASSRAGLLETRIGAEEEAAKKKREYDTEQKRLDRLAKQKAGKESPASKAARQSLTKGESGIQKLQTQLFKPAPFLGETKKQRAGRLDKIREQIKKQNEQNNKLRKRLGIPEVLEDLTQGTPGAEVTTAAPQTAPQAAQQPTIPAGAPPEGRVVPFVADFLSQAQPGDVTFNKNQKLQLGADGNWRPVK